MTTTSKQHDLRINGECRTIHLSAELVGTVGKLPLKGDNMKSMRKMLEICVAGAVVAACGWGCSAADESVEDGKAVREEKTDQAKLEDVMAQKMVLAEAVGRFADDCNALPDTLGELLDSGKPGWKGPYLEERDMLLDPWGREFIYVKNDKPFDGVPCVIVSAGPKGTVLAAEAEARALLKGELVGEDREKAEKAKRTIRMMKKAVLAQAMDASLFGGQGDLPDSLQQMIDEGVLDVSPDFLVDPWGHEYIYSKEGKDGELCEIYSAGPDGVAGTADDVHAKND